MKDNQLTRESELRQATVIFADISGFTAMSEKMHPEEVTNIMNDCFQMMGDCIESNGGKIDKFIGDCVMVVFGVPESIEKAPQKAVKTALEIRNRLYSFNKDRKLPVYLDIHIGINSGVVLSGMVGAAQKKDYTVMGDTVNIASRLEDTAERGKILVGPITYRETFDEFEYKSLPPLFLKGKADPIQVYELLSQKIETSRTVINKTENSYSERIISSRLIGRIKEMNKLRLLLDNLINGCGGIVTIIAEAGIGKSRLMAEFMCEPMIKQTIVLEGKSNSIGENLSFHPFINLLKNWAGIDEQDSESESFLKFEAAVDSLNYEETDEIVSFVGTLMGMKLSDRYCVRLKGIEGEALEKNVFKNVRDLLIRISERNPLIIYIEDFHWADASTIDLLAVLIRIVEKQQILFIIVFRPGYENTSGRFLSIINESVNSYHTSMLLEPLNEDESSMLIDNLLNLSGFPDTLREQITNRAGGNPFFIEEVIRSFIDYEAMIFKNGLFVITDKIYDVKVPLTINEVIMSRIDRLDKITKDLIKTASVIGRNFFYRILTAVAMNITEIDVHINYLEKIQLIRRRDRGDELEYLFKHILTQQTVYESVLIKKRKELHLQVAHAIEDLFIERLCEFFGMLAYHYNMGDDFDKAEEYLVKAGEEALKSSASNEAFYYYKEALIIYRNKYGRDADFAKIAMMEKNIGKALVNKGHYKECQEYIDRALDFYGERIPKHPIAIMIKGFADFSIFITGLYFPFLRRKSTPTDNDKEIFYLSNYKGQVLAMTEPLKFVILTMSLLKRLVKLDLGMLENATGAGLFAASSTIFSWSGISEKLSRKILEFVKDKIDMNNPKSVLYYKVALLNYNCMFGDRKYNVELDEELIKRNITNGEFMLLMSYFYWLSELYISNGDFEKAFIIENKIPALYNDYNNIFANVGKFHIRTYLLMKTRKLEEGIKEAEHGIQFNSKRKEFTLWLFYLYSLKSRIEIFNGDLEAASLSLNNAYLIFKVAKTAPSVLSEYLLGKFNLNLFLLEKAIAHANKNIIKKQTSKANYYGRQALNVSDKCSMVKSETLKLLGVYYWLIKKPLLAVNCWNKAITTAELLNDTIELSRVYFEIGKRFSEKPTTLDHKKLINKSLYLLKNKIGLTPEDCLEKAEDMFRKMNLQWDLCQVKKIKEIIL